ncbi:hypothetical protein C1H46_013306 [Malus baccata]|uniref:GDSL esterase/lipase n=1 Tax=Malus baccata TaxID=106549 RepID=A0A540MQG0_MALBA|nr:hypothetical protein C1H46_013306 [Malus baccata]
MARASLVNVVVVLLVTVGIIPHANCCYTSIIGSGDSLADTGNTYTNAVDRHGDPFHFFPPYGKIDLLSWLQPPCNSKQQLLWPQIKLKFLFCFFSGLQLPGN